jgi:hypothetical protein
MMNFPTNVETPNLWKSTDEGKTFSRVNVGTTDQGSVGNSDVDLAVATDGTLYFVTMTYDNRLNEGVNINIRRQPGRWCDLGVDAAVEHTLG